MKWEEMPDWIRFASLVVWPRTPTPDHARKHSQFSAPLARTIDELERELGYLEARDVVLQVALPSAMIRVDGKPRKDAKIREPGVVLTFVRESRSERFEGRAAAYEWLREFARGDGPGLAGASLEQVYRRAVMAAHPDRGGSADEFVIVQEAYQLLTRQDAYQFATDRFYGSWHHNLRAIAKGLEYLRGVERYGILSGNEQFEGFKQLTAGAAS